jgi:hypothetical protein
MHTIRANDMRLTTLGLIRLSPVRSALSAIPRLLSRDREEPSPELESLNW